MSLLSWAAFLAGRSGVQVDCSVQTGVYKGIHYSLKQNSRFLSETGKSPGSRSDVQNSRKELAMPRLTVSILLLTMITTGCNKACGNRARRRRFR